MIPRHPPDSSDDPWPDDCLASPDCALNAPLKVSLEVRPPRREGQDAPRPATPEWTEVEFDRSEAYLKGPTAFTA